MSEKDHIHKYLSAIGRRGGKKSRRVLSPEAARRMVQVREARRAFREFYSKCFWSCNPSFKVQHNDVPWVASQLMRFGGRKGWELGAKLCR